MDGPVLTAPQVRAARGLMGWSQDRLAAAAKVGNSTVRDFEAGRRTPLPVSMAAIRTTLEAAGVIFVAADGEGPGVRLRRVRTSE